MLQGQRILAVVPARSGSKGIPHKNMQRLSGLSLIGWTGRTLAQVPWIDRRIISTDSPEYAREGERYGLEAPFLRPPHLSTDTASAIDTVRHALAAVEALDGSTCDIVLVLEPSSPLRLPSDLEQTVRSLLETGADSVVTVSLLPSKYHPLKTLRVTERRLDLYLDAGRAIVGRQSLESLYWRNGVCYALTRNCLLEQQIVIARHCVAGVIPHPVVNIDEPWDLAWAEFLLAHKHFEPAFATAHAGPLVT